MPDSDRRATDNPEFSVIIPTFNRAHVLPRAIDSVLGQSHRDFELLVVDDGSSDGTAQCVAGYQDARIRYIRHEGNCGQNTALNTGLGVARGVFVSFLDSDDEWEPAMLETMRATFRSDEELGWVYSAYRLQEAAGGVVSPLSGAVEGWAYAEALAQGHVSPPTAMSVRRACFDVVGTFDPDNVFCNDDVMCLKLARAFKVGRVKAVLATKYEDGGEQMSGNAVAVAADWDRMLMQFGADIVTLCGHAAMARHYAGSGTKLLDAGYRWPAFMAYCKSVVHGWSAEAARGMVLLVLPRWFQPHLLPASAPPR